MRPYFLPLAATLLLATAGLARASDADFTLKNKTGYQIDEVYVSSHATKNWGRDRMGSDALADGETVDIAFPHGGSACKFDIKVKYHDEDTAEWGQRGPLPVLRHQPLLGCQEAGDARRRRVASAEGLPMQAALDGMPAR